MTNDGAPSRTAVPFPHKRRGYYKVKWPSALSYPVIQIFLRLFVKVAFRVRYLGLENLDGIKRSESVMFVANHGSEFDPVVVAVKLLLLKQFFFRRISALTKIRYFHKWYSRWFVRFTGQIPTDSVGTDGVKEGVDLSLDEAARLLNHRRLVGVFITGTRKPGAKPKTGASRLALRTGCLVVPIMIHGSAEAKFRSLITVEFGKPRRYSGNHKNRDDVQRVHLELVAATGLSEA